MAVAAMMGGMALLNMAATREAQERAAKAATEARAAEIEGAVSS